MPVQTLVQASHSYQSHWFWHSHWQFTLGSISSDNKKWKGSIHSDKIGGRVLFDPVKRVEHFYYFLSNNWNSSISYNRFKTELFY